MDNLIQVFTCKKGERKEKINTFSSIDCALIWIDKVLESVNGFSLYSELNKIQTEVNCEINPSFANKSCIPLYIINLVLKEFNLVIVDNRGKGPRVKRQGE